MKTIVKKTGLIVCLLAVCFCANAQQSMKVVATYPVSGNGRYDYLALSKDGKLYVSHGDQVNVLDEKTGKELTVIQGLSGVHGIAFDYENNKGFISNGTANNVSVFDLKTDKVTGTIETEKNPDGIIYEPFTKTIITGNGRSNSLSFINPKTEKVIRTLPLGGKPERAVSDGKGLLFVNIEDKSEIVKIDLKSFEIIKHIPLAPKGEEPSGLAIDVKNKLLFSGCSNKTLVIVDYEKGVIVNTYPIGDGCDFVTYNPNTETAFSSNGGDGTLTVLKRKSANNYSVSNVVTKPGARTMALNESANTVYLSAPGFSSTPDANGRKSMLPNSFKVIVVK
jgi:YVTN family beta-propeller protein